MEYLIVQPKGNKTSAERAWYISEKLFDLSKHATSHSTHLFNVVEHPDGIRAALEIDRDTIVPMMNTAPLAVIVGELDDTPGVGDTAQWAASMIGQTVTFGDLLPVGAVPISWEQMNLDGWFVTEEIGI